MPLRIARGEMHLLGRALCRLLRGLELCTHGGCRGGGLCRCLRCGGLHSLQLCGRVLSRLPKARSLLFGGVSPLLSRRGVGASGLELDTHLLRGVARLLARVPRSIVLLLLPPPLLVLVAQPRELTFELADLILGAREPTPRP